MATKVKGDKIKEGSIPLSALDDKSSIHLKDWGMYDYVGKLGEGVLELPLNYYQCIIYNNTTKKIYQIMSGQQVTLQSVPRVIVKYNGSVVTLYDPDNVYSNYQIFVYKGIKTINDAYLPTIETPTPDWNAQQGEARYIENKPFGKIKVNGELFVVSSDPYICNVHYCIPQEPDIIDLYPSKKVDCIRVYWSEFGGEPVYINEIINIPDGVTSMKTIKFVNDTPLGSFSLRFDKTESEIRVYLMSEDEMFSVMANDALNAISVEAITYFPDEYLPDTVLKTSPQTLSNTDKNQALANLGINNIINIDECIDESDNSYDSSIDAGTVSKNTLKNVLGKYFYRDSIKFYGFPILYDTLAEGAYLQVKYMKFDFNNDELDSLIAGTEGDVITSSVTISIAKNADNGYTFKYSAR